MKIGIAVIALCLVFVAASFSQQPAPSPPQDDVVKIATNVIHIDATVTDSKGKVIRDLTAADFELYENGRKQKISGFSFVGPAPTAAGGSVGSSPDSATGVPVPPSPPRPDQVRRTIALVVDDLSLSYGSMNRTRRSLRKFVEEQMTDGDLVAIVRVGVGMGALQQFSSDKRQLLAGIERLKWNPLGRGRIGSFEPINDGPESLQKQDQDPDDALVAKQFKDAVGDYQESIWAQGTLAALRYVINGLAELPGRKSVVLFSDGIQIFQRDEHGYLNGGRVNEALRLLIEQANRGSVVIYTMDARGLDDGVVTAQDSIYPSRPPSNTKRLQEVAADRTRELFNTQDGLVHLAEQTGGFPVLFQNDMNAGLSRVLEEQSYYLLAYEPDKESFDPSTARNNKIEIKALRDGAKVRYRSGFFNPTDEPKAKPIEQTPAQRLQHALTSPFVASKIALRMNALYVNNNGSDFITSFLHIDTRDLKFVDRAGGGKRAIIEVFGVTYGDNGVAVDKLARSYELDVEQGDYKRILEDGFVCYFNFPIKRPGPYQFRVAIRDTQSDTIGSASQFIEVPEIRKGQLALSGILVENYTLDQWQNVAAGKQQVPNSVRKDEQATDSMSDTSLRRFRRGSILHYSFDIYNAASSRKKLTTRLRVFHDGRVVLNGSPQPVDTSAATSRGHVRSNGALTLPLAMQLGDYVLQIIVSDGTSKGQQAVQYLHFELN